MHPRDDTECLRDVQMSRTLVLPSTFQPISSIHNKFEENQSPEKQPCCSSPMVDVFLAGPSSISINAFDSPYLCSKKTENASQEMDGRCSMITENQTNFDHNESAGPLAPSTSSALNEFIDNSLGTSDFHWSKMHKYTSVKVENKLKASFHVKESNEMSHDEQHDSVFTNTDICRALPSGSQNEKRVMEQKRIDIASFQSMNNQNLTHGTLNNAGSFLYYRKHMGVDISGNPELGQLGLNFKFTEGSLLDVHAIEKSIIPAENLLFYDEEASQHQCAMRKHLRLQAAENHRKIPGFGKQIRNFKSNVSDAESAENLMGKYTLDTPIVEPTKASSSVQYVQSTVKTGMSCKKEGGPYVTVPSLFFVGQATHTDTQLTERDIFEGEMPFSGVNDLVVQTSKDQLPSTSLNSQISFSPMASEDKIFHRATNDDNDMMFGCRNLNEELPISSDGYQALFNRYLTPSNIKTSPAENFNSAAIVSREKRKKGAKNEGQNFCNCKRSQCLKLYCRCFAAGTVCTEACGCHECFNSSQHEETILKTRNQIEFRNPLAFAPKILLGGFDPPNNNEEGISSTPSSARHKRGCNCRKSLCLKKYCECFQAGVGCSLGCHCDGCKNTFGTKDRSSEGIEMKHVKPKEENLEMESSVNRFDEVEKMEVPKTESGLRLSPLTPSIECSKGTGADSPTPLLHRGDSSPRSPIRSIGDIKFEDEELDSLFPYNQERRDSDTAATLSPRWDDFQDLFILSPLASPPPRGGGGDAGTSDASEAEIPQRNSPQEHATSLDGSLQLRCSPVTPPPQLGEGKILPEPDTSIGGAHTTPADDVLNATPLSTGAVKLSSPMQKRISHKKRARDTTPGLRNTRQFISKSVP